MKLPKYFDAVYGLMHKGKLYIDYAKCFWHMEIMTDIQCMSDPWQSVNFCILLVICVRECMAKPYEP